VNRKEKAIIKRYIAAEKTVDLLRDSFPTQTKFINNPSTLKAAQCSRRAGKSYGMGLYLFKEALENPGVSCLYVALTSASAKRIMFKDVFKDIARRFKIKVKFNQNELTVTFANGSIIYCVGMDQSEKEQEKALGQKFKLVVIDECASFRVDLKEIVYKTLQPAVADYNGTICMIGTTGNRTKTFFNEVTTGKEPGWDVHKWTFDDNPYTRGPVNRQIKGLIEKNPAIVETPLYKQMYLNQWVVDEDKLVYKYQEARNLVSKLPEMPKWNYVVACDIGYEDDTAYVVYAWNEHHPHPYIVHTYKKKKMDVTDVAEYAKVLMKDYNPMKMIIDGANKQAVEEMRRRHNVPWVAADKTGKSDFIEIMNGDLIQGVIKLVESETYDLVNEWLNLIWDDRGSKRIENASCPNHLADAALYGYRFCYSYLSRPIEKPVSPHSVEAVDQWWEKEAEKMEENEAKAFWEEDDY